MEELAFVGLGLFHLLNTHGCREVCGDREHSDLEGSGMPAGGHCRGLWRPRDHIIKSPPFHY